MKKFVLFIFLFLVFSLPAFADYKPIPKELSKQYKYEIEKLINKKYNPTIKEINRISKNAEKMYMKVLKNKDLYIDFATKNYDTNIFVPIFDMLSDIITITQKYTNSELKVPATDFSGALYDFLDSYFIDNNIDTSKIDELSAYARNKQIKIEQYYDKAHKFIYPNDNY
jgi:hypothetical protein